MNETKLSAGTSEVPGPLSDRRMRVPDTSLLPGSELPPPAPVKLLNRAVRGAHDTLDRLADRATPTARFLGERASAAGEALRARTDRLRYLGDEGVWRTRDTVRRHPLLAIAVAAVAGALIARVLRRSGRPFSTR